MRDNGRLVQGNKAKNKKYVFSGFSSEKVFASSQYLSVIYLFHVMIH